MSLKVRRLSQEPGEGVTEDGHAGVNNVWVVLERADLKAFSSRMFRMAPGGHTSMHAHEREHVALVLGGTCRVECGTDAAVIRAGHIVAIPPNAPHRFSNPSKEGLALLIMNFTVDPGKIVKAPEAQPTQ